MSRGTSRRGAPSSSSPRSGDVDREHVEIQAGDCFRFRPQTVHRLRATEDTLIIEVSTPEIDDVVRLEDAYGREGTIEP